MTKPSTDHVHNAAESESAVIADVRTLPIGSFRARNPHHLARQAAELDPAEWTTVYGGTGVAIDEEKRDQQELARDAALHSS
jgi:hypothetical protein